MSMLSIMAISVSMRDLPVPTEDARRRLQIESADLMPLSYKFAFYFTQKEFKEDIGNATTLRINILNQFQTNIN